MMKEFNANTSNCLNCCYEPKWGTHVMNIRCKPVRRGHCRWPFLGELNKQIPLSVTILNKSIEHVLGDKGVNYNCPAWQGVENDNG